MKKKDNRNRFNRPIGFRKYRKIFIVFTEGTKTEPMYFNLIKQQCNKTVISVQHVGYKTSPQQILTCVKKYLKTNDLKKNEELWIVSDTDNHEKEELETLFQWEKQKPNYGLAISNPCFEYWLLLHYEKGNGKHSPKSCKDKLRTCYLPNYKKNNLKMDLNFEILKFAVENAIEKNKQCRDPYTDHYSTMYLLIEKIIEAELKE